jgi:hypothetical protein
MPLKVYNNIAKKLFFSGDKEDVFCHLFFVLDWCLMKRAENCVGAKINHISFRDDALVFEFAKTKGNQTGDEFGPWHVYANPKAPWICPVLAFARYLFCYTDVLRGDAPLFQGSAQYSRYSTRLAKTVGEMEAEDLEGYEASDFGSHSARKGVATWVAGGCTVSPPIVALCLRAGWSLGGVKDRYLFYENAGDQYVGRCASGLRTDSTEFAISRPYFDYSQLGSEEEMIERKKTIKMWLKERLPGDTTTKTFDLAMNCFSSICYSYKYLQEHLHKKCLLRQSPVFRDIPEEIYSIVTTAYPWNKTTYTPSFTGIPPHVVQLNELKSMQAKLDALKDSVMDEMKCEMEKRGFASTECNTKKITDAIDGLGKMIERIAAIGGTHPADHAERGDSTCVERFTPFVVEDEDELVEFDSGVHNANEQIFNEEEKQLHQKKKHEVAISSVRKRKLTMGCHHGMLTPLPQDWEFPSMTWTQLIFNWFLGNTEENLPPLVNLDSRMVRHCNKGTGNKMRSNMAALMRVVEREAREKGCWVQKKQKWTNLAIQEMIDTIRLDFINKYLKNSNRQAEASWSTVYVRMSQMGIFARNNANQRPKKQHKIDGLPSQSDRGMDAVQTTKVTAGPK